MTLDEAVAILNANRHRRHSDWYSSNETPEYAFVCGLGECEYLEPFEAIAIAEKYVKGGKAS